MGNIMNAEDRLFIFVSDAKIDTANTIMKSIDVKAEDTGNLTFGNVPLSADGKEPATHYACNTAADNDYKGALFGTSHAPWMVIYKESDGFTWDSALKDMGLVVINGVSN